MYRRIYVHLDTDMHIQSYAYRYTYKYRYVYTYVYVNIYMYLHIYICSPAARHCMFSSTHSLCWICVCFEQCISSHNPMTSDLTYLIACIGFNLLPDVHTHLYIHARARTHTYTHARTHMLSHTHTRTHTHYRFHFDA